MLGLTILLIVMLGYLIIFAEKTDINIYVN